MIPVIADPRLQELYATASNEMMLTQGIVSTAAQAFITALNERLEAADRMAQRIVVADQLVEAIDSMHHSMRYGMNLRTAEALAAYRQSKERT